jgi:hypothetical protein
MSKTDYDGTKTNPNSSDGAPKGVLDRVISAFVDVIKSLPTAARALIVIFALLIAGGVLAYHFRPEPTPPPVSVPATTVVIQNAPATKQYINGSADPNHAGADNSNIQNVEAGHKASEDIAAYSFHFGGPDRIPDEQSIGKDIDTDNYLHFRYFETDKCLYVNRREGGTNHYQWLRDPNYHKHDVDQKRGAQLQHSTPLLPDSAPAQLSQLLGQLLPTAQASVIFDPPVASDPPQANFCQNPHPGTFKFWWGPPIDQCNSPMYRQFDDGCTHYQVYNRCSNSWDGRINWTACHPPPHH